MAEGLGLLVELELSHHKFLMMQCGFFSSCCFILIYLGAYKIRVRCMEDCSG